MAEVLGVVSALTGIVTFGLAIAKQLYDVSGGVAKAPQRIKQISEDVKLTSDALASLNDLLSGNGSMISQNGVANIQKAGSNCEMIFKDIQIILNKAKSTLSTNGSSNGMLQISLLDRGKWVMLEPQIEKLRTNLNSAKIDLLIIMNIHMGGLARHVEERQAMVDTIKQLLQNHLDELRASRITDVVELVQTYETEHPPEMSTAGPSNVDPSPATMIPAPNPARSVSGNVKILGRSFTPGGIGAQPHTGERGLSNNLVGFMAAPTPSVPPISEGLEQRNTENVPTTVQTSHKTTHSRGSNSFSFWLLETRPILKIERLQLEPAHVRAMLFNMYMLVYESDEQTSAEALKAALGELYEYLRIAILEFVHKHEIRLIALEPFMENVALTAVVKHVVIATEAEKRTNHGETGIARGLSISTPPLSAAENDNSASNMCTKRNTIVNVLSLLFCRQCLHPARKRQTSAMLQSQSSEPFPNDIAMHETCAESIIHDIAMDEIPAESTLHVDQSIPPAEVEDIEFTRLSNSERMVHAQRTSETTAAMEASTPQPQSLRLTSGSSDEFDQQQRLESRLSRLPPVWTEASSALIDEMLPHPAAMLQHTYPYHQQAASNVHTSHDSHLGEHSRQHAQYPSMFSSGSLHWLLPIYAVPPTYVVRNRSTFSPSVASSITSITSIPSIDTSKVQTQKTLKSADLLDERILALMEEWTLRSRENA